MSELMTGHQVDYVTTLRCPIIVSIRMLYTALDPKESI